MHISEKNDKTDNNTFRGTSLQATMLTKYFIQHSSLNVTPTCRRNYERLCVKVYYYIQADYLATSLPLPYTT